MPGRNWLVWTRACAIARVSRHGLYAIASLQLRTKVVFLKRKNVNSNEDGFNLNKRKKPVSFGHSLTSVNGYRSGKCQGHGCRKSFQERRYKIQIS